MSKEQESISKFLSKLSEIAENVNEYLDKWLPQNEEEYFPCRADKGTGYQKAFNDRSEDGLPRFHQGDMV